MITLDSVKTLEEFKNLSIVKLESLFYNELYEDVKNTFDGFCEYNGGVKDTESFINEYLQSTPFSSPDLIKPMIVSIVETLKGQQDAIEEYNTQNPDNPISKEE